MNVIQAIDLKKNYRNAIKKTGLKGSFQHLIKPLYENKIAVNGLNFSIKKGEKIACIGPNGAGKSTTIKMLTGILIPTSGQIIVNNLDPYKNRIENAKHIGAVFGQRTQLWWDIPVVESFNLLKDIYGISNHDYKERINLFNTILNLDQFMYQPARKLSLGQRMRADIAAALLHNPSIVYLDEPTIGLDVAVKEKVHDFLNHINREFNTTIFLTSHDLSDTERVCNRLIIIDNGIIMYDDSLEKIKNNFLTERKINIVFDDSNVPIEKMLETIDCLDIKKHNHTTFSITFQQNQVSVVQILDLLIKNTAIKDFSIENPSIESIIKKVYNRTLFTPTGE